MTRAESHQWVRVGLAGDLRRIRSWRRTRGRSIIAGSADSTPNPSRSRRRDIAARGQVSGGPSVAHRGGMSTSRRLDVDDALARSNVEVGTSDAMRVKSRYRAPPLFRTVEIFLRSGLLAFYRSLSTPLAALPVPLPRLPPDTFIDDCTPYLGIESKAGLIARTLFIKGNGTRCRNCTFGSSAVMRQTHFGLG
jgi:hypothetical protein